jgi:hypothetical protein
MIKTAFIALAIVATAGSAVAQIPTQTPAQAPTPGLVADPSVPPKPIAAPAQTPIAAAPSEGASPSNAIAAATPIVATSSSQKAIENPAAQFTLMKTVVGRVLGIVQARALPVESGGYNLLKYCWTPINVLGEWAEPSGMTGEMVVRALETQAWSRDLVRAGYPEAPVAEAIGRYEAALVGARFANAARTRALEILRTELDGIRLRTPGAAEIHARYRCNRQVSDQAALALKHATLPEGGKARFIPFVLHQFCLAQQIDPSDGVRCDYWMAAKDGPMSFAGETVYSVAWPNNTITTGRFNPDEQRTVGTVTLRERPAKK